MVGDESAFDALRTGPSGDGAFDPELAGRCPRSPRARRRGPRRPAQDPRARRAARFDDVLEARGVVIHGVPRGGVAPAGAIALAGADSAPVTGLSAPMLEPSDDWIAELLTKALAPRPGSTAAGAALIRSEARGSEPVCDSSTARPGPRATAAPPRGLVACCAAAWQRRVRQRARAARPPARSPSGSRPAVPGAPAAGRTGTLPSGRTA